MANQANQVANATPTSTPKKGNNITQTRQQLVDQINSKNRFIEELKADLKAIASLLKSFNERIGIPEDPSLGWIIKNRKAVIALIKDIVKVIKTKNAI